MFPTSMSLPYEYEPRHHLLPYHLHPEEPQEELEPEVERDIRDHVGW